MVVAGFFCFGISGCETGYIRLYVSNELFYISRSTVDSLHPSEYYGEVK